MAKTYQVSYVYQKYGVLYITADSLEEAEEMALEASVGNEINESYIEGSFEVEKEINRENNSEE